MDLFLREVDEGFQVQVVSERGKQLPYWIESEDYSKLLTEMGSADEDTLPSKNPELSLPGKADWVALFDAPVWMRETERCLSCRLCATV